MLYLQIIKINQREESDKIEILIDPLLLFTENITEKKTNTNSLVNFFRLFFVVKRSKFLQNFPMKFNIHIRTFIHLMRAFVKEQRNNETLS